MRLYVFSNMYLSPIQHGIQGLHAMGEIALKYPASSRGGKRFRTWLRDHKTVIVLNAGYSAALAQVMGALEEIAKVDPGLPFASFNEEGLDNALTSVAVVLDEEVYDPAPASSNDPGGAFYLEELLEQFEGDGVEAAFHGKHYSPEVRLAALCKNFRLA